MFWLLKFYQKQLNFLIILFYSLFFKKFKTVLNFSFIIFFLNFSFRTEKERDTFTYNRSMFYVYIPCILKGGRGQKSKHVSWQEASFSRLKLKSKRISQSEHLIFFTLNKGRT